MNQEEQEAASFVIIFTSQVQSSEQLLGGRGSLAFGSVWFWFGRVRCFVLVFCLGFFFFFTIKEIKM